MIIREIEKLAADGVVEVMLLGQNVNSYGKTLDQPMTFAQLLEEVEKVDGIRRIRFMTSHPQRSVRRTDRSHGQIRENMPASPPAAPVREQPHPQEDEPQVPKEQYLDLVDRIRAAVPDISLTTDIIVGFPGETEEDFLETLDVVRRVRYDSAFTFIYTKRTGTPAAAMEEQVPQDVVKDRFDRLLGEVQDISAQVCAVHEGTVQEVLAESVQ